MILAGDIGGTKTDLALYHKEGKRVSVDAQVQFASREFSSLAEVIEAFEKQIPMSKKIDTVCFGVAGPVMDGVCRTTNLPWEIDTSDLQKYFNTEKVRLINDLEATAYGMIYLDEDDFVDLNPGAKRIDANRAVIAAGTGLGEAILFYDGVQYHPVASEGGHCDFAPLTKQQDALLRWLRDRYPDHVSYERILSGSGIYTLYDFLSQSGFAPEPDSMKHIPKGKDPGVMVSECALNEGDPLCLEALKLFSYIYGAEAGNLALKSISVGGVYIGGGIAPKIVQILKENHFMNGFVQKGRFEKILKQMQVRISLNPKTALLGAAYYARDKF